MSGLSKKDELFKRIESCLVTTGLDETDAKIYVLALSKGRINSSDVAEEFSNIRQNTAVARLKNLANKGFLETISKETLCKKPYVMNFKVIHPRIALKDILEQTKELPKLLGFYDEHWEALAENPTQETEIWLSKSERIGIKIGASILSGAKQYIKIYSNDCSWCKYQDIETSLRSAHSHGATITVIAHNPEKAVVERLKENKVALFSCTENYGPPFCVVDSDWLILPVQSGTVSRQFSMLRTNDRYLIAGFLSLFETVLSCSSKWGRKNV
jgi:sugar-specific transcriptional regulator TrmB